MVLTPKNLETITSDKTSLSKHYNTIHVLYIILYYVGYVLYCVKKM